MQHIMHVCQSWERDPSSVALPEVSSIFFPHKQCFCFQYGKSFLTWIKGLRTEDVFHCKAYRGNVIVGFINKTELNWFANWLPGCHKPRECAGRHTTDAAAQRWGTVPTVWVHVHICNGACMHRHGSHINMQYIACFLLFCILILLTYCVCGLQCISAQSWEGWV